jgi:hypothetical protein
MFKVQATDCLGHYLPIGWFSNNILLNNVSKTIVGRKRQKNHQCKLSLGKVCWYLLTVAR